MSPASSRRAIRTRRGGVGIPVTLWDRGRLHIGKAKAGGREQPLTPSLVAILRAERQQRGEPAGYIFAPRTRTAPGDHRRQMSKPFARAVKRAGLNPTKVTPHVMRHTAIARLVQAGIDLPTIQRISGHKTLAMVLRYAHVSGAHIDAAMAAIDRTIPEPAHPNENATSTLVTQELHKARFRRRPPKARIGTAYGQNCSFFFEHSVTCAAGRR